MNMGKKGSWERNRIVGELGRVRSWIGIVRTARDYWNNGELWE